MTPGLTLWWQTLGAGVSQGKTLNPAQTESAALVPIEVTLN
jgi:hypothetical protein